jgi:sphingosine-1-phosphate phosphatase 1
MTMVLGKSWVWMEYLKDPYHVWRFQQYFGVEKVKVVENKRGAKFFARNIDHIRPQRTVPQDYLSTSSCGDYDGKNVVFYRINSWFWYYLFLIGTQLGDETYYSIFFCFWFWNIDGAVGRRVILVWNLVMYIGTPYIQFEKILLAF